MTNVLNMTEQQQHLIAVVDDDASLRRAMARLLSVFGYRVEVFASAEDFLSAAATCKAACLIVDLALGETTGLDLARRLSAAGFAFPIIFVSGSDDRMMETQCMDFGCVAFLRKPFLHGPLMEAIAKAVGSEVVDSH